MILWHCAPYHTIVWYGITCQRYKWSNTDPQANGMWYQVPRSKHSSLTGETPLAQFLDHVSRVIYRQSQCAKNGLTIGMTHVTHLTQWKFVAVNYNVGLCNDHRTCETLTSNETSEIPVTSTVLPVAYLYSTRGLWATSLIWVILTNISHVNTCKITFLYCGSNGSGTMTLTTWLFIRWRFM
jgi:hypothetical protein